MASTLTQFDAFLKDYYTKDKIDDLTKKDRPFFGMVKREEDLGGDQYIHPFIFQNPQGFGATLAKAQQGSQQGSGNGNIQGRKWKVAYGDYSASVEIGDKVIKASRSNVGAFLRDQETEINGLYNGFGDTFSTYLYSNGGQSLGQFSAIAAGVCTLTNADDVVNFEVGQILVVSVNDGSDPAHIIVAGSAQGFVVAVNRNAGTVTVSLTSGGVPATPAGWVANQFLFRDGDFGGVGSTRILLGLGAWIPSSDPSATVFENINRTTDVARMSGIRLTTTEITGLSLEQRLKRLVTRMRGRNFGPGPTAVYLNPEKWQNVADSLESRGYREIGSDAEFGYENISFKAGGKTVKLYADPFCPVGSAFALKMDTIKLGGLSKIPEVVNGDGLEMLRKISSNDYEYRLVAYPAFVVAAPGFCGRVATV
jgi:hypothetical protein